MFWMIDFSRVSSDSVIGKFLRRLLTYVPKGICVPILQGRLKGRKWIVGAGDNHGFWLGSYECETQKIFEKYVMKGMTVYDIGANVGFFTLLSAVLTGEKGCVVAVEPLPENVSSLRRHISINHFSQIRVVESAVCYKDGEVRFAPGRNTAEGALSSDGGLRVKAVTIDTMVFRDGFYAPQVMKIDVEGAEGDVLRGARKTLEAHHPIIFLSTHGATPHADCLRFLRGLDYELSSIDPNLSLDESPSILACKVKG